jgi:hypothetical protein
MQSWLVNDSIHVGEIAFIVMLFPFKGVRGSEGNLMSSARQIFINATVVGRSAVPV